MKYRALLSFMVCSVVVFAAAAESWALQRAIWVTRWDYRTPEDIRAIMENAKRLFATDVYFQVRGAGTVYYPSRLEPWAWELTGSSPASTGGDPGWNPLATAITEAKERQMRIHAWVNVMPGWRGGATAPQHSGQLWATRREWFMVDHLGNLMTPPPSWYNFLSPAIPEVQDHLTALAQELVDNYPQLDGLHLDYIRYPGNTELRTYRNYSFDAVSVQRFQQRYGRRPHHESAEWSEFKCEQISEIMRRYSSVTRSTSTPTTLSATFFADMDRALKEKGQNPKAWMTNNWVDWTTPMVYQRSVEPFRRQMNLLNLEFPPEMRRRISIGLLADNTPIDVVLRQMEIVKEDGYGGVSLFAYSSFFTNHRPKNNVEPIRRIWREESLQEVLTNASLE